MRNQEVESAATKRMQHDVADFRARKRGDWLDADFGGKTREVSC